MDIKKELLVEHSKVNALRIAAYIGDSKSRFKALLSIFLGDHYRSTQRAAWVLSICSDKNPEILDPYLETIILNLKNNVPVAVKRSTLKALQEVDLPDNLLGEAAEICFGFLSSSNEPIAVKVFSMTVLLNIVKKIPELKNELKILVEDQMPFGSAGFKSRGKKTLAALAKI